MVCCLFCLSGCFHRNLQSQTKATNHLAKACLGSQTCIFLRKILFIHLAMRARALEHTLDHRTLSPFPECFSQKIKIFKNPFSEACPPNSSDLQTVPPTLSQCSIYGVISQNVACHIKENGFIPTCSHSGHECLQPKVDIFHDRSHGKQDFGKIQEILKKKTISLHNAI